jgi:hypothetical protein
MLMGKSGSTHYRRIFSRLGVGLFVSLVLVSTPSWATPTAPEPDGPTEPTDARKITTNAATIAPPGEQSSERNATDPAWRPEPVLAPHPINGQIVPSLLLEPGVGLRVTPETKGAGTFSFAFGLNHYWSRENLLRPLAAIGFHAGYTIAPVNNRAEVTLQAGLGVGSWILSLRGGPSLDTSGAFGFRAGIRGMYFGTLGAELYMHHTPLRKDASIILAVSLDLVPVAAALFLAGLFSNAGR